MKNVIKDGKTFSHTAAADIASGDLVLIGSGGLFGVACGDIANGEVGELSLEDAVFEFPAVSSGVIALGAPVYWDAADEEVNGSETDNTKIGYAYAEKASGTASIQVKVVHS